MILTEGCFSREYLLTLEIDVNYRRESTETLLRVYVLIAKDTVSFLINVMYRKLSIINVLYSFFFWKSLPSNE